MSHHLMDNNEGHLASICMITFNIKHCAPGVRGYHYQCSTESSSKKVKSIFKDLWHKITININSYVTSIANRTSIKYKQNIDNHGGIICNYKIKYST